MATAEGYGPIIEPGAIVIDIVINLSTIPK